MVRHISIYYYRESVTSEQEQIVEDELRKLGLQLKSAMNYQVGRNCMSVQRIPGGAPRFGNLAQVIDFATEEDAKEYPAHPGHIRLMERISLYVGEVAAIDYRVPDSEPGVSRHRTLPLGN